MRSIKTERAGTPHPTSKPRGNGGFTLGESLVALLIVLLVSLAVATGTQFAIKQYHRSMVLSESKILCSTLSNIISGELSNTRTVKLGSPVPGRSGVYELNSFFSSTYANKKDLSRFYSVRIDEEEHKYYKTADDYGELVLGTENEGEIIGNLLISSAAYSTYHLQVNTQVTYDVSHNIFSVTVNVRDRSGVELVHSFDVLPLNEIQVSS